MSNFFNLLANSILVPTPTVQATNIGSLIFIFLKSNNDPNPPIISFSSEFLTLFLVIEDICLTSLLANEIFTPLFL